MSSFIGTELRWKHVAITLKHGCPMSLFEFVRRAGVHRESAMYRRHKVATSRIAKGWR